ncbi:sterol-binding protein [Parvibaculum sedimenti]|uniref:Sterol-binding protein n=1 Tax=Parvibaculum sedimenti TaxID=2608632 RepID=A0A6N6VMC7_9HYPH|nr:SCP2 sterol-binding domain-containing protein [Parvibaculum sedimenti]KAB7740708.1 sterol-binding protein [Parvibaculum sedimenti]
MKATSIPADAVAAAAEITLLLRRVLEGENLGAKLKFDYGAAGCVVVDGRKVPNEVHNRNEEADCTVQIDPLLHLRILHSEVDLTTAFRQGKMRVMGDVGVAVGLTPIVARKNQA